MARHPHNPIDACITAADRATVFVEVAGREPTRADPHSWLDMVQGLACGLRDEVEDTYPDVPFDGEHDLATASALAYAIGAVCRDAVQGSNDNDEYHARIARGLDVTLALASELGRVAERLEAESERLVEEDEV